VITGVIKDPLGDQVRRPQRENESVRTSGPSIDVGSFLVIAFVGVPLLIGHFGSIAACVGAGFLILAVSAIRIRHKVSRAEVMANQLAGATVAQALATRKADPVPTSCHNNMLVLSELIIMEHAAELTLRRRQLTVTSAYGSIDESQWLRELDSFIERTIEPSGAHVTGSPELLLAVRWMIGSATAQFASSRAAFSPDRGPIAYQQEQVESLKTRVADAA
jgi:hypothetical protein